jgi:hypothetical protein
MDKISSEHLYSAIDLNKAYLNGLECAVAVMEKVIALDYNRQRAIIKSLEKLVRKYKMKAIIGKMQI